MLPNTLTLAMMLDAMLRLLTPPFFVAAMLLSLLLRLLPALLLLVAACRCLLDAPL